ncbi:hypothetical protein L873DRAFT_1819156 [Choiromyces venosus 120613-1]|uniref:Uncharacterized protein n=1 Tax=Choiromyces venosus 120613-1 TaxID=1336337 RepID=A0A3N4JCR2_9PEZI|nr:hypothetical protein L873DRAFT_1819155 [Choiromyces venosus 120613-1]RPA91617.1 hypothetical protein L873DRAFT_1819156 [Choiromyces venosus 120613-1]
MASATSDMKSMFKWAGGALIAWGRNEWTPSTALTLTNEPVWGKFLFRQRDGESLRLFPNFTAF